ncbi:hypothetical protein ACI6QG_10820 [Roseococcus sp. DSY-14]|uniref:hypothetical protein n=1 Tax=Roseococcus sp. DSY-14 TaxID=3369650 RepID=UPI00387B59D7
MESATQGDMTDEGKGVMAQAQDRASALAADAQAEIAALRAKVETLMNERVTPALSQAADQAEATYHTVRERLGERGEQVSERVREQPLLALALAALAGFVVAAMFRRG